jgi:hypothetical protein
MINNYDIWYLDKNRSDTNDFDTWFLFLFG